MVSNRRFSERNWYIGMILLTLGLAVLAIDAVGYSRTGEWIFVNFITGIKFMLQSIMGSQRQFAWIQNPTHFVWLFWLLSWFPTAPTMIALGLVGISVPSSR